jgi:hypothetical protein
MLNTQNFSMKCNAPTIWGSRVSVQRAWQGKMNEWVGNISYYGAEAYCKWAGLGLPTAFEFEYVGIGVELHRISGISDVGEDTVGCEWTSTSGFDFDRRKEEGKRTRMLLFTCFGMSRNSQMPTFPRSCSAGFGFRCACDIDLIYSFDSLKL